MSIMLIIYIDADACPVKNEANQVAHRHNLQIYFVSNSHLNIIRNKNMHQIQVSSEIDAADNWIEEHIKPYDIVVTSDILLADRCLKKDARVINSNGRIFNDNNIGIAKSMRNLQAHLRETGVTSNYNASFSKQDRSHFLQTLETVIQQIIKIKF